MSCKKDSSNNEPNALSTIGINSPAALHTISSQFASAFSTFMFYPFDFLRTRYMSQDGTAVRQHNRQTYHSIRSSFYTVYREEGIQTLYRGCSVAVVGAVVAWGVYMYVYRSMCNLFETTSYSSRSLISMFASAVSCFASSPIFLVKSRMQLEESSQSMKYKTFRQGFLQVVRQSGVRGLWKGVGLQLLLVFPNALGIPTYDFLKYKILTYRVREGEETPSLTVPEVCVCSALTKILLLTLSHPMVLLRVRIQDERALKGPIHYHTILQSLKTVVQSQGVLGMYRGFTMSILYSLPRSLFYYTVYEKSLSVLSTNFA